MTVRFPLKQLGTLCYTILLNTESYLVIYKSSNK